MAEIIGLAASIVQLGGAGAELSIKLYNFVNSATRADRDMIDLAEDLDSTGSALNHIGRTLRAKDIQARTSPQAIKDATKLKRRCELVFVEIQDIIQKRQKIGKDGKESLTLAGKMGWPLKEQRVELLRRRLDSLKLSLSLLLDVLKLSQGEAQGKLQSELEKERETIRALYKQREKAFQRELALEDKLKNLQLEHAATSQISIVPPRAQIHGIVANNVALASSIPHPQIDANKVAMNRLSANDPNKSDGNTTTTDDEGENLTLEELEKCATHVQELLRRIADLQNGLKNGHIVKHHRKRRMHKSYQRFCRRFEANLVDMASPTSVGARPTSKDPLSFVPSQPPHREALVVTTEMDSSQDAGVAARERSMNLHSSSLLNNSQKVSSTALTASNTIIPPNLRSARKLRRPVIEWQKRLGNPQDFTPCTSFGVSNSGDLLDLHSEQLPIPPFNADSSPSVDLRARSKRPRVTSQQYQGTDSAELTYINTSQSKSQMEVEPSRRPILSQTGSRSRDSRNVEECTGPGYKECVPHTTHLRSSQTRHDLTSRPHKSASYTNHSGSSRSGSSRPISMKQTSDHWQEDVFPHAPRTYSAAQQQARQQQIQPTYDRTHNFLSARTSVSHGHPALSPVIQVEHSDGLGRSPPHHVTRRREENNRENYGRFPEYETRTYEGENDISNSGGARVINILEKVSSPRRPTVDHAAIRKVSDQAQRSSPEDEYYHWRNSPPDSRQSLASIPPLVSSVESQSAYDTPEARTIMASPIVPRRIPLSNRGIRQQNYDQEQECRQRFSKNYHHDRRVPHYQDNEEAEPNARNPLPRRRTDSESHPRPRRRIEVNTITATDETETNSGDGETEATQTYSNVESGLLLASDSGFLDAAPLSDENGKEFKVKASLWMEKNAPTSLIFRGDMEGRIPQLLPMENSMNELATSHKHVDTEGMTGENPTRTRRRRKILDEQNEPQGKAAPRQRRASRRKSQHRGVSNPSDSSLYLIDNTPTVEETQASTSAVEHSVRREQRETNRQAMPGGHRSSTDHRHFPATSSASSNTRTKRFRHKNADELSPSRQGISGGEDSQIANKMRELLYLQSAGVGCITGGFSATYRIEIPESDVVTGEEETRLPSMERRFQTEESLDRADNVLRHVCSAPAEETCKDEWVGQFNVPSLTADGNCNRDIVDVLLEQWTVPVTTPCVGR
ncbi:hypothetical protein EKO04_000945 [Ascochyta lentis]|uniref:Fungal N-terminal domain-containing protein n=1 Tax=Ascochyta lentis TaxID=205686 RepID=A0A8H7MMQ4_9PLEO|nr:hypothetical protein EKO04_000945 [Ascochyta lentis]